MVGVKAVCAKCKRKQQPGVQLIYIYDMYLCGDCYLEYQEKLIKERRKQMLWSK